MDFSLTAEQRDLIELARELALTKFAPRAAKHDREASFPFDDYDDLRKAGLLNLCIPKASGGLGADFQTYALVSEQIAQGNASTALSFNMHSMAMLMMGDRADAMDLSAESRALHNERREKKFLEVIERGVVYGQPHSEPIELGETDKALNVGGRRFGTVATKVDGGYRVNGAKFFVSLSGAADYFATPALLQGDGPWIDRTLYLQVPGNADGVSFEGEWDPLGMRGTVSRAMVLKDVFIPDDGNVLPPGMFGELYNAYAHGALSFSSTFLGLMQAAYDFAVNYLRGLVEGAPGLPGEVAVKGYAVAEMLFMLESSRAMFYRSISEAQTYPSADIVQRARAAHVSIQRNVVTLTQEAIRVCGGRAMLKQFPLERYARDARAAAVMRPWTQDIATQQTWECALGFGAGAQLHQRPDTTSEEESNT